MYHPPWLIAAVTLVVMVTRSLSMHVVRSYRDRSGHQLQMVDLDQSTGDLVIATEDSLSRVSADLLLQQTVKLNKNSSSAYSYSKGILVDRSTDSVILCSLHSGLCEIHSFSSFRNVNQIRYTYPKRIVPNSKTTHSVLSNGANPHQILVVNNFKKDEYTKVGDIPTISSRRIDNLYPIHEDSTGSSSMFIDVNNVPDKYFVQYIYTFSNRDYNYFISIVPSSSSTLTTGSVSTRISRLCAADVHFRSYVEIQLDCIASDLNPCPHAQAAHYDQMTGKLYMGHACGKDEHAFKRTALCVYDMKEVNDRMDETVRECYRGNGHLGPIHFHKTRSCLPTTAEADLCGQADISEAYSPIEGLTPISQHAVIVLPDTSVTALTTHIDPEVTSVYLGTADGRLLQVTVAANGLVSMANDIVLDLGEKVSSQMFIDKDGEFLYAMTQSKLMKVQVEGCGDKSTCEECTAHLDSVCGWCVLQNRCTKVSSCPSAAVSPTWLPARHGVCAQMKDVYPSIIPYEHLDDPANSQISFNLDKVTLTDPSKVDLHCKFVIMETQHKTVATILGDRITCPLPEKNRISLSSQGTGAGGGVIRMEFQVHGKTIVKRDVPTYDCRIIRNCTSCSDSSFGCKWCHVRGMCVEAQESNCPDQMVAGIKSSGSCPRLETSAQDTDIVVHSGHKKSIAVRVANLKPDQYTNIHCLFTFEDEKVMVSDGNLTSSNLLCDPLTFAFNDTGWPIVTAVFSVTAGPNNVLLDNPQNIKVRIYKCRSMVTNCGQCISMDPEYECGWCTAGMPQCSLQSSCPSADWLGRSATCPNPQILRFDPLTGPIRGSTNISVTGINLGKSYNDLQVTVAGRPCVVLQQNYEISQRFVCQIVGPQKVKKGEIRVKVNKKYTAVSDSLFKFVEPTVASLSPKLGPVSGGTTLVIKGEYMNSGTMTSVDVGGSPCNVVRSNMTSLACVAGQQVANENSVDVEVNFGNLRKLVPEKFTYVADPQITMIAPKDTILSGGTSVTVVGNRMRYIQKPRMFVTVAGRRINSKCVHKLPTWWLVCKTPALNFPGENVTETSPREVHYGFLLDGVSTYQNISADANIGPLLYYPDPEVNPFPPSASQKLKKYNKDQLMVIKGNFGRINPVLEDVRVTVGGSECTKPSATDDALSCQPPSKPKEVNAHGNAAVMLQIGNMRREVGYMNYYDMSETKKPIAVGIILGVALPILAIIVLLAVCVWRRHRKHQPSDNYIPDVWKDTEVGGKEEDGVTLNNVAVKAEMNGSIPDDKETGPYIESLLAKIDDDAIRHNVKQFLIARRQLDVGDLLGKGNFGVTCKATFSRTDEENPMDVAVKTMQGNQTDDDSVTLFLQTVTMYRDLQHPGVAPIVGVCISAADDPILVLPYAQYADLKSYVRDSNQDISVSELLDFSHQISEALAYLESVHVVHGNLALRNCLVMDGKRVQVSDYGLTKELFTNDQYFMEGDKLKALVKWAAPEVISTAQFTAKSDMWSFGVVLWELLTRGVTPYPDVENVDLQSYLEKGNRMKKPRLCPEKIYEMMLKCWALESDLRPTFSEVSREIHAFSSSEMDEQATGEQAPLCINSQDNTDMSEGSTQATGEHINLQNNTDIASAGQLEE